MGARGAKSDLVSGFRVGGLRNLAWGNIPLGGITHWSRDRKSPANARGTRNIANADTNVYVYIRILQYFMGVDITLGVGMWTPIIGRKV